jgi:hypothetical protein
VSFEQNAGRAEVEEKGEAEELLRSDYTRLNVFKYEYTYKNTRTRSLAPAYHSHNSTYYWSKPK